MQAACVGLAGQRIAARNRLAVVMDSGRGQRAAHVVWHSA